MSGNVSVERFDERLIKFYRTLGALTPLPSIIVLNFNPTFCFLSKIYNKKLIIITIVIIITTIIIITIIAFFLTFCFLSNINN